MTKKYQLHPETAKKALDKFETGELVHVVELGGLGPGYEQCIWIGIFRMIKAYHKENMDDWVTKDGKEYKKAKGQEYLTIADEKLLAVSEDLGLSGAQAGVIKHTAWQIMKYGWRHMMEKAPKDRLIMVSKDTPQYEVKK